jgi:DNA polymerase elongation subunit (family B)
MASDITFHLLDCAIRDEEVVAETEDALEVAYETASEASDEEYERPQAAKKANSYSASLAKKRLVITLFGSTADGRRVCARVRGFCPFFYLEIPADLPPKRALKAVQQYLVGQLGEAAEEVVELTLLKKKRLFGYSMRTEFNYIQVSVPSAALFQKTKRIFLNDKNDPTAFAEMKAPKLGSPWNTPPLVYEANLDPLLRFMHLRNISPCNWISVEGLEEVAEEGTIEIDTEWDQVSPTAVAPAPTAPFVVASWDIEVWSSTGEFPLAQRSWSNCVRPFYHAADGDAEQFVELLAQAVDPAVSESVMPAGCYKIGIQGPQGHKRTDALQSQLRALGGLKKLVEAFKPLTASGFKDRAEERDKRLSTIGNLLSKNLDGGFPLKGDPVIQIGTIIQRLGTTEPAEKHIFVLGSCTDVPDAVVHVFDDEAELICSWCAFVADVDIFIGYNIFGFDERYIWNRMEELAITDDEAVQALNRLEGSVMKLEEKRLSSSAMGDNFLYLWTTTGRLRIDVFHHIKRNAALASYKLDDTSRFYLSEDVADCTLSSANAEQWVITYKPKKQIPAGQSGTSTQGVVVGAAVVLLSEDGANLCEKMPILAVNQEAKTFTIGIPMDVEPVEVAKWAIVKDDVSPAEMFKLHLGSAEDRAVIAKYCVQDCALVLDLFKKLEVFNYAMSMANVCSVPVSYIFLRGQGIKIESLIFKYCYEKGYAVQVIGAPKGPSASYEGAIVLTPKPQFATVPVGVADFASLYPSTMISENISFDTLVWVKDYDLEGRLMKVEWLSSYKHGTGVDDYDGLEGVEYTDIEFDLFIPDPNDTRKNPENIKIGTRVCRYAQDSVGMVPQIVSLLLAARKAKREELKKTPDPFKKALLDSEQNAYKITANSLYGQLGSPTFKLRLQYLAASVTAYGRKQIMFARDVILRFYGPESGDPRCCASSGIQSTHTAPGPNGAEIVYGDSVTADTPIYIRIGGVPMLNTIGNLASLTNSEGQWKKWHETKEDIPYSENNVEIWTDAGWTVLHRVIRHRLAPGKKMYRVITSAGMVECSEDHSLLGAGAGLELKPTDVSVGVSLLHNHSYSSSFNCKNTDIYEGKSTWCKLEMVSKISIAEKCIEIRQAGFYPHYSYSESNGILTITSRKEEPSNEIIYMAELEEDTVEDDYIYDLQTANHHFSVGPGALVVHNTDSLFVCFNPKDPSTGQPLEGQDALKETIHLTEEAGQLVTKALKAPHDFEFDKVYWPFLIFSKKRYVGHKYEELDHYTQASMGIALKRRDYAPIVKKVYGGAVEILLKEKDVPKAVDFVQRSCVELIQGKYGLGPLTISKSLRAEYANPQGVAHKVLADRMAARDPGTAPTVGDRIPFIYIQPQTGQQAADLQGDRVEHPSYIKEKNLKPDYMFYITNQISNPVIQMFGIMLEQMPGYAGPPAAGWSPNPEKAVVQRESAAYEILFRDAINAHKNSAKAQFMSLFKGLSPGAGGQLTFTPKESTGPKQKAISIVQPPKPQAKQTLLDQFFTTAVQVDAHKQIVKAMDKKLKKGAKEAKEAKEGKEA